jgi:autotransporter-associated beta strand protein
MKKINYCRNSFLAAAALALLVNQATAATWTWIGGNNTGWHLTTGWSEGTIPAAANTTDIVMTNAGNQSFIRDNRTIRSLTFTDTSDGPVQIALSRAFTAGATSQSLTFSSDSGNATLTVASGSTGDKQILRTGTLFSDVNLTSSLDIIHNGSGTLSFGGQTIIKGLGGIDKSGTGTLILNGANTYTGDTKISGGTLTLGNSLALLSSTLDYNSYGGTLDFGALTKATFGGLKGTQNIALTNNFALSVGNNNANTTYSGALSGTGATLTKIGSGTLTLSATNSYTGATSVSNGVLKLTLPEALSTNTAVNISTTTGAKIELAFSGTVTVKSLTVDGELLTRNKVYSSANLPIAFAPGDGLLYTLEGTAPKGTMIRFF